MKDTSFIYMQKPLISNIEQLAQYSRVLLLQGPIGGFFLQLANWLNKRGTQVYKINLNGGDDWFYPSTLADTFNYTQDSSQFSDYISRFIKENQINAVVCFGDTRLYHQMAKQVCLSQNISFWVFEEGYFRPYWVTLEKQGVNAYSLLPKDATWFQAALPRLAKPFYFEPKVVEGGFAPVAKIAIQYYFAMFWKRKEFPNYQHHRASSLWYYSLAWLKSGWRRVWFACWEKPIRRKIVSGKMGRFFILPLQVNTDSQIRVHSDYANVRECLLHVLSSFAIYAPNDCKLVIKHHPMDRGFIDYRREIKKFLKRYPQLKGKIIYIHDIPLPDLLRQGVGMVTVNSTSGLSALIHNMPVKILGKAAYDIAGITSQQTLRQFWRQPEKPNSDYFHAYRVYHINQTQINGNFYTQVYLPD